MALSERHTRLQDGPRLGLLSRSQSMKHMKDRWLCVGSSRTRGMFPYICFATDEAKQQKRTLFSLFGACSLVVHHRMAILAMGREASGINRWLPLVFHVAPLYTWPNIPLAKTNTFLHARRGRTCFHKSQVRRVARNTRRGFQERQILPARWQKTIKSWQMSLEHKRKSCRVTAIKWKITVVHVMGFLLLQFPKLHNVATNWRRETHWNLNSWLVAERKVGSIANDFIVNISLLSIHQKRLNNLTASSYIVSVL